MRNSKIVSFTTKFWNPLKIEVKEVRKSQLFWTKQKLHIQQRLVATSEDCWVVRRCSVYPVHRTTGVVPSLLYLQQFVQYDLFPRKLLSHQDSRTLSAVMPSFHLCYKTAIMNKPQRIDRPQHTAQRQMESKFFEVPNGFRICWLSDRIVFRNKNKQLTNSKSHVEHRCNEIINNAETVITIHP